MYTIFFSDDCEGYILWWDTSCLVGDPFVSRYFRLFANEYNGGTRYGTHKNVEDLGPKLNGVQLYCEFAHN